MNFTQAREQMVDEQLVARGISDTRVLAAMRAIPRHQFVDSAHQLRAYDDTPLPIDAAQTISQPYMVALMTAVLELRGTERVLEVGTGSGYQAAVLAELAGEVFSVERIAALSARAQRCVDMLSTAGRIHLRVGDGNQGWPERAPFDAIIITAAVQQLPRPLIQQLCAGGALVLPLGDADVQGLARIRKSTAGLQVDYFGECRFVKLIGEYGWEG